MGEKDKNIKNNGLLWAVIITWTDFPLLYWGVAGGNQVLIVIGLCLLGVGTGLALYHG